MYDKRRLNPPQSPESLEERLRSLPPPPVPADLQARLLSAVPARLPTPHRRWPVWAGVACALAAAGVLLVVASPRSEDKNTLVPTPPAKEIAHQLAPPAPGDLPDIAAWRETRQALDGAETAPFTWPIQETSPIKVATAISPDVID